MKFGVIFYNYEEVALRSSGDNLGDHVQTIALLNLYKRMGVPKEEIVFIGMQHLHDYDGDYVLLPIIGVGIVGEYAPPYSNKIIPIFISSHFVLDELKQNEIDYLCKYAPIGCRDEWTLNTMRKYNIPAFLSGCITILMDADRNIENDKIYAIDVPEFIKPYLDEKYKEEIVYDTHLVPFSHNGAMTEEDAWTFFRLAEKRVKQYQNAKLLISSRMHALIPAMVGGTPVIGVFDNISYRFSWLDKYIPLYTKAEVNEINFFPDKVMVSEKSKIEDVFIKTIRNTFNKYNEVLSLSQYYESRKKSVYGNRYREIISDFIGEETEFDYMIFGCGLIGTVAHLIISEQYPKANFIGSIDNYVTGEWKGKPVDLPDNVTIEKGTKIIIASYSGRESAFSLMKKLDLKETSDYCYIATTSG